MTIRELINECKENAGEIEITVNRYLSPPSTSGLLIYSGALSNISPAYYDCEIKTSTRCTQALKEGRNSYIIELILD